MMPPRLPVRVIMLLPRSLPRVYWLPKAKEVGKMVAMKSAEPMRPKMTTPGVLPKKSTRKKAKKPRPSTVSMALLETLPVMEAPSIRPRNMMSQKRLFIIWDCPAVRMPMSWK